MIVTPVLSCPLLLMQLCSQSACCILWRESSPPPRKGAFVLLPGYKTLTLERLYLDHLCHKITGKGLEGRLRPGRGWDISDPIATNTAPFSLHSSLSPSRSSPFPPLFCPCPLPPCLPVLTYWCQGTLQIHWKVTAAAVVISATTIKCLTPPDLYTISI